MRHIYLVSLFIICVTSTSVAQGDSYEQLHLSAKFKSLLQGSAKEKTIISQLDTLFFQVSKGNLNTSLIQEEHASLTIAVLKGLKGIKAIRNDEIVRKYRKELLSFYPITKNVFSMTVGFMNKKIHPEASNLKTIFRLIATYEKGIVKFSIPLKYMTTKWKSAKIGTIDYYYNDTIQLHRARQFNLKNATIAKKLNVQTEQFKFYMCANYQEILKLLGYEYQLESANTTRLGYGVEQGYIFSIMNNEDFSHDIFHYYSGKINEYKNRNWIAEEGIANSWGNAYYTDLDGEMISLNRLVLELKKYLENHKNTSLFSLFENNTNIFNHIAPDLSVRSVISGVICDEIETQSGISGILAIINSKQNPSSIDAYLRTVNDLIKINKRNFNKKVALLLKKY